MLKNNGENQATLSQKVYLYTTTKLDQAAPPDRGKVPYCCERKWVVSLSVKLGADGTLTCILSKDNGFLSLLQIHRTEPPEHRIISRKDILKTAIRLVHILFFYRLFAGGYRLFAGGYLVDPFSQTDYVIYPRILEASGTSVL